MGLYDELCECAYEERKEKVERIFNDKILKNMFYTELQEVLKRMQIDLYDYEEDEVINDVLMEIETNHLDCFSSGNKRMPLKAFLRNWYKHYAYMNIANRYGISQNDLTKVIKMKRIATTEDIPIDKDNAWLISRLSNGELQITSTIRAIENYKKMGIIRMDIENDTVYFRDYSDDERAY